jgi:hypothetical protein
MGASSGGAGSDAGTVVGPDGAVVTPIGTVYGPTSGRRLTRDEYLNTIADLFGAAVAAQAEAAAPVLDDTPRELSFRNDVTARTVNAQYVTEYQSAAAAVATSVTWSQLAAYASCTTNLSATCQSDFIAQLGRVMYRRPLTTAEVANLSAVYAGTPAQPGPNDPASQDPTPFQTGSRLVLEAMLLSPNFLYQLETQQAAPPAKPAAPTAYEIATRIAMLLWKSGPDAALLDAAAAGKLASPADRSAEMAAMLADARARRGVRAFADDWLGVYSVPGRTPLPAANLTASVLADMRNETLRFVERVAIDDNVDLTQMLLDKKTELSPELARLYGLTPIGSAATAVYDLSSNPNRIGLLTQPATLGVRAGPAAASIAQRGHWVMLTLLCQDVGAPPDAATAAAIQAMSMLSPTAPERAFFALHETLGPSCQGCHSELDPLGFPFVTYDVAGAFRAKDANGNVLQTGGTLSLDGMQPYQNVAEFSAILAKSPTVDQCLVSKYVQYAIGRTPSTDDVAQLGTLVSEFRQQGRQYAKLAALVATSSMLQAPARDMYP